MTVLQAIEQLINERKSQKRIPHCAMLRDVLSLVNLHTDEFQQEVAKLKKDGKIAIKETINSYSFYLC